MGLLLLLASIFALDPVNDGLVTNYSLPLQQRGMLLDPKRIRVSLLSLTKFWNDNSPFNNQDNGVRILLKHSRLNLFQLTLNPPFLD